MQNQHETTALQDSRLKRTPRVRRYSDVDESQRIRSIVVDTFRASKSERQCPETLTIESMVLLNLRLLDEARANPHRADKSGASALLGSDNGYEISGSANWRGQRRLELGWKHEPMPIVDNVAG